MLKIIKPIIIISFLSITLNLFSQDHICDSEGNKYKTFRIGTQVWMAGNLNSKFDSDGDTIESYCFYNEPDYCKKYGRLYPWTSLKISGTDDFEQGICPDGWHIPSDNEWDTLTNFLGGVEEAGKKLKDSESYEFNIAFGGNYNTEVNVFSYIDDHAYFWTSTKFSNTAAWMRQIGLNNKNINRSTVPVIYAFSIRCVKD